MNALKLCERYRDALSKKDLPRIQELFTPGAIIEGPISGTANVTEFHPYLFKHMRKAFAHFPNVLKLRDIPCSVLMQFSYTFTTAKNVFLVELDGVLKFEIDKSLSKIKKLTYVYDPTDLWNLIKTTETPPPASALSAKSVTSAARGSFADNASSAGLQTCLAAR